MNREEIDLHLKSAASIRIKNVDKAISMVEEAIDWANKESYDDGYAQAKVQLAHYTMMLGEFDKALSIATEANDRFFNLNNENGVAEAMYVRGNTYLKMGELHNGLTELIVSLKIFESAGDKKGQAKTCNSIGYVYKSFKDYKNALKHYQINLEISTEFEDLNGQSNSHNHIAQIHLEQGEFEKGLEVVNLGIPMKRQTGDKRGLGIGLHTKGKLLARLGQEEEALTVLKEALEINEIVNDVYQTSLCNASIGAIYLDQKNDEKAFEHASKALSIAKNINAKEIIYKCEHYLFEIAKSKGNYEKALEHFKCYHEIKGEVTSQEKNLKVKNIQLEYQVELAEKMQLKNQELELAHNELAEQHKSISDSIKYAKRLQSAILPSESEVDNHIPNNFILYTPKDVVSGDFYWFERCGDVSFIAAADCTGHGVPGAMVSVVCSNALNRCVNEFNITEPSQILDTARELVIRTFAKSGEGIMDGMDIALCAIHKDKVVYAGANNPLWIVRKNQFLTDEDKNTSGTISGDEFSLIEFKASKQAVGLNHDMTAFSQTEISLQAEDTMYLFSDGFADQFGGENGKKYKYKPFKRFLLGLHGLDMAAQKKRIHSEFLSWKGDLEQTDDVCIIGVKI